MVLPVPMALMVKMALTRRHGEDIGPEHQVEVDDEVLAHQTRGVFIGLLAKEHVEEVAREREVIARMDDRQPTAAPSR